MWDKRVVTRIGVDTGIWSLSLSCLLKMVEDDRLWLFSSVYGPCDDGSTQGLWEELKRTRARWHVLWCLGGDFNVVRSP